jgi:hypothetical protein
MEIANHGISIKTEFLKIPGRILPPPKVIYGQNSAEMPRDGRWNLRNKQLIRPMKIASWALLYFPDRGADNRALDSFCREVCTVFSDLNFAIPGLPVMILGNANGSLETQLGKQNTPNPDRKVW